MSYKDLGYNNLLIKIGDNEVLNINSSNIDSLIESGAITFSKTTLNKLISNQDIESEDFETGTTGWRIQGNGNVEFNSGVFRGSLVAGSVHIPDQTTTANSFHVNTVGNTWWGCTEASFNSNPNNAAAYILNTGACRFSNITITGGTIQWSTVAGTTNAPANNATVGATWNSNISGQPSDASITNPSYITSTKITATTIESPTISAGTIIGATIKTNDVTYPYATMNSSGITIHGQTLTFNDTSGNLYGYVYGSGSFNITASSGRNLVLAAGSYLYFNPTGNFVLPSNDNDLYLGGSTTSSGGSLGSDYTWKYVGAQIVDAKDLYKLNDITVIDQSGSTIYIKGGSGGLILQKESTTVLNVTSSLQVEITQGSSGNTNYRPLKVGSYSFRPVGFTFKDGSGNNKYMIVLATADPVNP